MLKLWRAAEKAPALGLVGDKAQLAGFGDARPWHTAVWKHDVRAVTLKELHRTSGDPEFQEMLDVLRVSIPDQDLVDHFKQKVIWGKEPTVAAVCKLLHAHPDTTVICTSRWGADAVNNCALQALFPRFPPRTIVAGDIESNPKNYIQGKLKPVHLLEPTEVPIFIGMTIFLTRNVRKDIDFVNGMKCRVDGYDSASGAVLAITETGHHVAVGPWADTDLGGCAHYPLKGGYASTVIKMAGAELPHVTVFLDAKHVPAAAYTAISRVGTYAQVLFAGAFTPEHFTPAVQ